jgi:hypothetical protein
MTYAVRDADITDSKRLETLPAEVDLSDCKRLPKPDGTTPLLDVFTRQCEEQAALVAAGADLLDAVDDLQSTALAYGLVRVIGQDAVQEIMSGAFLFKEPKQDLWPPPNWKEYGPRVTKQQEHAGEPQAPIEAVMSAFRESGGDARILRRPENRELFSRMSQQQRDELRRRMKAWSLHCAA